MLQLIGLDLFVSPLLTKPTIVARLDRLIIRNERNLKRYVDDITTSVESVLERRFAASTKVLEARISRFSTLLRQINTKLDEELPKARISNFLEFQESEERIQQRLHDALVERLPPNFLLDDDEDATNNDRNGSLTNVCSTVPPASDGKMSQDLTTPLAHVANSSNLDQALKDAAEAVIALTSPVAGAFPPVEPVAHSPNETPTVATTPIKSKTSALGTFISAKPTSYVASESSCVSNHPQNDSKIPLQPVSPSTGKTSRTNPKVSIELIRAIVREELENYDTKRQQQMAEKVEADLEARSISKLSTQLDMLMMRVDTLAIGSKPSQHLETFENKIEKELDDFKYDIQYWLSYAARRLKSGLNPSPPPSIPTKSPRTAGSDVIIVEEDGTLPHTTDSRHTNDYQSPPQDRAKIQRSVMGPPAPPPTRISPAPPQTQTSVTSDTWRPKSGTISHGLSPTKDTITIMRSSVEYEPPPLSVGSSALHPYASMPQNHLPQHQPHIPQASPATPSYTSAQTYESNMNSMPNTSIQRGSSKQSKRGKRNNNAPTTSYSHQAGDNLGSLSTHSTSTSAQSATVHSPSSKTKMHNTYTPQPQPISRYEPLYTSSMSTTYPPPPPSTLTSHYNGNSRYDQLPPRHDVYYSKPPEVRYGDSAGAVERVFEGVGSGFERSWIDETSTTYGSFNSDTGNNPASSQTRSRVSGHGGTSNSQNQRRNLVPQFYYHNAYMTQSTYDGGKGPTRGSRKRKAEDALVGSAPCEFLR